MLIKNLLEHKKNTTVLVNGHTYAIAQDRVIRDPEGNPQNVPEEDAVKLLANQEAWAIYDPSQVAKVAPRAADRPRIQLVTATGDVLPPPPLAPQAAPVAASEPAPVQDPPIPAEGEEWADPQETHSLDWLQACAKAYKIKVKSKDKAALVTKIRAAMYG